MHPHDATTTAPRRLPLWPDGVPGRVEPGQADHPRAAEVPCLEPFLLPPAPGGPRPLVVVCPGGGYANRAGHEGAPVAAWCNGLGLHAAVCQYRVFPWRHPQPLLDAQRAVRLVRHHAAAWGVDPARVALLGFSAGGHLACSAANLGDAGDPVAADPVARQAGRPDALVACYPVITAGEAAHRGSFQNLLGDTPDPADLERLSLERSVGAANPPAFIWHTADDPAVPVDNALLYAAALRRAGVPFALHVYPRGHHGLGLAGDCAGTAGRWTADCAAWFRELGWT